MESYRIEAFVGIGMIVFKIKQMYYNICYLVDPVRVSETFTTGTLVLCTQERSRRKAFMMLFLSKPVILYFLKMYYHSTTSLDTYNKIPTLFLHRFQD